MDRIGSDTQASNQENEDFLFTSQFGAVQLLVVGDFARVDYSRIDAATANALKQLTNSDNSVIEAANKSIPLLLSQLATKLNGWLLGLEDQYKTRFQCVAMFAAIRGTDLFYLPVGDCRLSVYTGSSLLLLNGSIWGDSLGNSLPMLIDSGQGVYKTNEPPPNEALGVSLDINLSTDRVKHSLLEKDDLVMLYSDGVDKFVSPVRLLEMIREHAGPSTQALAEKIIDEVRLEHGNDDRTFVILSGPHEKEPDPSIAASRQELHNVTEKIAAISERISSVETSSTGLDTRFAELKASVDTISTQITQLPTLDQLKSNSAKADSDLLKGFSDSLKDIGTRLTSIQGLVGVQEDSQKPNQNRQSKKSSNKNVPAPDPDPRDVIDSKPTISQLDRLNLTGPLREGLLRIQPGFYELVDESAVLHNNSREVANCIVPPKSVPPGWMTATYLSLRLLPDQPHEEATADSVKTWVQKHIEDASNAIVELQPEKLRSLRDRHWELRDRRRKIPPFGLTPRQLIKLEEKLAKELQLPAQSAINSTTVSNPRPEPKGDMVLNITLAIVVVLLVILAVVFVKIFWLDTPNTSVLQSESPPSVSEPVTLEYGAEGRELFVVPRGKPPEPIKYSVKMGKERVFREKFAPQQSFKSREELIKKIETEAPEFVISKDGSGVAADTIPAKLQVFTIESADVTNPPTGDKCVRFLNRVNNKLPQGVHNELTDLQSLNPGIKCNDLKPGDRLLVIATK